MQFFVYLTQIEHSIGTIIFILDSTDRRFAEVLKTPYHDKHSMKFIGSTAHNYRAKMIELVILALAKTIEDLISAIEKNEGIKIRFWQDLGGYKFYKKARLVRHLSNVIKHHEGVINKGFNVHDCDVLIDEFGFPDDF